MVDSLWTAMSGQFGNALAIILARQSKVHWEIKLEIARIYWKFPIPLALIFKVAQKHFFVKHNNWGLVVMQSRFALL